ncbi:hypothetical protein K439DRAFT_1639331 [Ramaria rubella]|nr:hypothetical protein K439DRAFT_1639331 [Ramaria rubella]
MPLYTVQHSCPLTSTQQDELAQVITNVHCSYFDVPRQFVNISYQDLSKSVEYVGGKVTRTNRIIAGMRPNVSGAGRTEEVIEALLREIHQGWDNIVGTKGEKALGVIVSQPIMQVIIEKGVLLPKAGLDFKWIQENLDYFKARAAGGEEEFASLVEDLEAKQRK